MDKINDEMLAKVANELGIETALLKAVKLVESGHKDGFLVNDDPVILFEGHIMYRELKKKFPNRDMASICRLYPRVVYKDWTRDYYLGGISEYSRFNLAKSIDEECALKSASWGMFQIMGFNYRLCGCKDVFEFVRKMKESNEQQLKMMVYFLNNSGSLKYLKKYQWAEFARRYNGPSYAVNHYDQKLKNAYTNFKRHESK